MLILLLLLSACQQSASNSCAGGAATDANVTIRHNLKTHYAPGESDTIEVWLELDDPKKEVCDAVVFLNVVEFSATNPNPPAAPIVAAAEAQPQLIGVPFKREALLEGVSAQLSFRLSDNATPKRYSLILQVFRGDNTNPSKVKINDRIGFKGSPFFVNNTQDR